MPPSRLDKTFKSFEHKTVTPSFQSLFSLYTKLINFDIVGLVTSHLLKQKFNFKQFDGQLCCDSIF